MLFRVKFAKRITKKSRIFITFCFYALSLEYPQALCSSISCDCNQRGTDEIF